MAVPSFTLTLFGPFEARYDDQPLPHFATDKIRALLAYLAVESGKPIRRETLAALFWPDFPDDIALRNLRQSLYRLRETLKKGHPDLAGRLLTQDRISITLNPEAAYIDALEFTRLVGKKSAGDLVAGLYRGAFLEGISIPDAYAFEEWLRIQREVFHQQALEALARLIHRHEAEGNPDAAIQAANTLLAIEPWHEKTHRQIMRAYLRKGDRTQAIAQYRVLEAILDRELGVEPAPATTALFHQNQEGTSPIRPDQPAEKPTPKRPAVPAPITPLVGRQPELTYLVETMKDPGCRLVTLTGPGGVGKTRLAIELAHQLSGSTARFPDGIAFVSLSQIAHGGLVVSTVAHALGFRTQSQADPRNELIDHLSGQGLLLMLDNLEHLLAPAQADVLPEVIAFLVDLLAAAPGITVLATSREALSIQAEWVYPLEGLPYAGGDPESQEPHLIYGKTQLELALPAPQLFIQNARRYRPSFDPAGSAAAILEICRLTDGLPLALELAASWLRLYSCEDISARIAQSLDFLTSPLRDTPARQRSIRIIFESTWEQLHPDQQDALAAMSVFQGGFTIQAALSITNASVLDLAVLVQKSLLRRQDNQRYFLHEIVRQFAGEKLAESGRTGAIKEAHARHFLAFAAGSTPGLNGPNPNEALTAIRQEADNIRLAWNWAVSQGNIAALEPCMEGLAHYWVLTGASLEGEASIAAAIDALRAREGEPGLAFTHSFLESYLAWLRVGLGKNKEAEENIGRALALAEGAPDPSSRAFALSLQGWVLQTQGNLDKAEAVLEEAGAIYEKEGKPLQLSLALIRLGSVYWRRGLLEKAVELYERSLEIEERLGNKRGINRALGGMGMAYNSLGKLDLALGFLNKSLLLDRELGNQPGISRNLGNMGNIYFSRGNYERAMTCYREALEIDQKTGNKNTIPTWQERLGNVFAKLKDAAKAMEYYEEAILITRDTGNRFGLCEVLSSKAALLLEQGHLEAARPFLEESLKLSYEIDRKDTILRGLILKARWLAQSGQPGQARQLLESSREILASEYQETETNARFFYELWQIDGRDTDAEQALLLYRACLEQAEHVEYDERIAELTAHLAGGGK